MSISNSENRWQSEAYAKGKFIGPIRHDEKIGYFGPCGRFFEVDKYVTRKKNFGTAWVYKSENTTTEFTDVDHGGYIGSLKAALTHSRKNLADKIAAIKTATTITRVKDAVTQLDIDKIIIKRDQLAGVHRISVFSDIEKKMYTYDAIPLDAEIGKVERLFLDAYRARLKLNTKFRYKYTTKEYLELIELYLDNRL